MKEYFMILHFGMMISPSLLPHPFVQADVDAVDAVVS